MHGSDFAKGFSKALGWKEIAQDQERGDPGSNPSPATDCCDLDPITHASVNFLVCKLKK